jgi:uncharacterized membrane protein
MLRRVAVFMGVAALANVLAVAALPHLVNLVVMHKLAALAGGENRALHAPRADANARAVVRPSPDMLYTACVFDVSGHPLRISAPVQDSYVSISGFAADTSNFFAINDTGVEPGADGRKIFDIVLTRGPLADAPPGTRVVLAPSSRGLILFRSLITNDAELPRLQRDFQSRQLCAPL